MSRKRRNDNQNPDDDDDDGVDEGAEAVSTTTEQSTTKTTTSTMGGVLGTNRSNNIMNPRRMVRARRPEDSSRTNSTGFGGGMGNSPPNFFANVRLSTGSTIPTTTTTTDPVATSFPGILATKNNNNNNNINNNKLKEFCEWKLAQDKAFIEKMEEGDLGCHDQTNVIWEYMYHRRLKEYEQRTVNGSNQQEAADGISNTSTTNPHKRNKDSTTSTSASASSGLQNNNKNSTNNDNNAPALSFGNTSSSQAPPKLSFGFPSSSVTAPSNPLFGFGQSSTQKTTTSSTTSASSLAPFSFTAAPGGGGFSFTPSSNSGTAASTTAIGTSSIQGKISFGTTTLTETEEKTNLTSSSTNESNDQAPEGEDLDKVQKANDKYWKDIETSPAVRIYHQDDPSVRDSPWKSFASGALYLQVKKDDSTAHRIVMRSSSGQNVLVNMKIFKDMTFLLSTERNSKAGSSSSNKEFGIISFRGTNDIKRGMESFKLKAAKEAAEILYQQLQASVAVSK